jgi:hypothetical protein
MYVLVVFNFFLNMIELIFAQILKLIYGANMW